MKHIFFFAILVCLCFKGYAQQGKDYFYKLLQTTASDTERVKCYLSLSDLYSLDNTDSCLLLANKGLDAARLTKSPLWLCKAQMCMGLACQKQSKYKEATSYFFEALKTVDKVDDENLRAKLLNSIATCFAYMKQYDMAETYFLKAYDVFKKTGDDVSCAKVMMNLGNIFYTREYVTGHFSECYKYYREAMRIAEKNNDIEDMATLYGNLAMVYTDDGKYDEALVTIDKGMALARQMNSKADMIFLDYYAGKTYAAMKNFPKAESFLFESVKLAEEMKNDDCVSEGYLSLADMYYSKGDYKVAYDYYEKYKHLEDTLLSRESTEQLNELKTIYETEKKEKELELSNQKIQTQSSKLRNQQIMIFSSIGGALLLLVLVLVLYNRSQIKQKANTKLALAYATIEEKNKDITDSINYAQQIQQAILPDEEDIRKTFPEIFILFKPRDVVSGDFYWYHETPNKKYIAAADCTGHGVPGAMMSMIGSSLLNQVVIEKQVSDTGLILDGLRDGIKNAFKQREGKSKQRDGMDIALLGFSPGMRQVQFSGANNGLYLISGGTLKEFSGNKQPVGQHEGNESPFSATLIDLQPGDCLYLYSDGFADQFGGEKGKKFKYAQLKQLLLDIHSLPLHEQEQKLDKAFTDWKDVHAQVDDVLVIGIRV